MLAAIVALTWGGPNQVAVWTFGLLWVMRLSACRYWEENTAGWIWTSKIKITWCHDLQHPTHI